MNAQPQAPHSASRCLSKRHAESGINKWSQRGGLTYVWHGRADDAGRVWGVEDLAWALPKLVDLHLQGRALVPTHRPCVAGAAVGQMVEHIVRLHRRIAPLLVPAQSPARSKTSTSCCTFLFLWIYGSFGCLNLLTRRDLHQQSSVEDESIRSPTTGNPHLKLLTHLHFKIMV